MRTATLTALIAYALLLAASAARAQNGDTEAFDQVLQLLAARQHGHVSFTEEHSFKMLTRPLHSSGELLYDAPDHLEKRTLQPRPESLILDHGVLTARRGQHSSVLPLKDYPQIAPFVESIRATLAGDRTALERYFNVQFSGTVNGWSLRLRPLDPALRGSVQEISISGARERMRTVEIDLSDDDRSVLTIGADITP
jgi:Outer membrane lipoprotein carrier protein LolA-like